MHLLDDICGFQVDEIIDDSSLAATGNLAVAGKAPLAASVGMDVLKHENEMLEKQLEEVSAEAERLQVWMEGEMVVVGCVCV